MLVAVLFLVGFLDGIALSGIPGARVEARVVSDPQHERLPGRFRFRLHAPSFCRFSAATTARFVSHVAHKKYVEPSTSGSYSTPHTSQASLCESPKMASIIPSVTSSGRLLMVASLSR